MSTKTLDQHWQLCCLDDPNADGWETLLCAFDGTEDVYSLPHFPMQVHDVLLDKGVIENPNIRGVNHDTWIHDKDWAYLCQFKAQAGMPSMLSMEGVDTFADVWLNGRLIARCDDAYLSWDMDVSQVLQAENTLIVRFRASQRILDGMEQPEQYQGLVPAISAARVFRTAYHDYCGPTPNLIRCGLYDAVTLFQADTAVMTDVTCDVRYDPNTKQGAVEAQIHWLGEGGYVTAELLDGQCCQVTACTASIVGETQIITLQVEEPSLWYPWTHGDPAVYMLRISTEADVREMTVGFRTVNISTDLAFEVNGHPFRPWGANLMHLDTLTNCFNEEKMIRMLDLAQLSNCNMLRVWGEADKLPECFYDLCDRRGIMLWQDFFLGCSLYSEEAVFMEACGKEAAQMIRARKHHPSIALWCGGNELYLARDYQHPDAPCYGEKIVQEVFPPVCKALDPNRLYYPSSPCGGDFANDPQNGDTHGYTHLWFVPGRRFPLFLSENCRVSTPTYASMQRMMTAEELWPADYQPGITRQKPYEWPESWNVHTPNEGWRKLGPAERFYDAYHAHDMVDRIGLAHAAYIRDQVSDFRRGRSGEEAEGVRHTNGHLLWRLNDNSNVISFGVVDYFLNPGHAFYEMKRCYAPLFVSVAVGDHAGVWVTNDTPQAISGTLRIALFHLEKNQVTKEMTLPFDVVSDGSSQICTLDNWGQFRKENIVWVRAVDENGELLGETMQPCDFDRRLPFPTETGLRITPCPGGVEVSCDHYARAVELTGDAQGEPFGWVFSDNFFDLIPGQEKIVAVSGEHRQGTISARSVYDDRLVSCVYQREEA